MEVSPKTYGLNNRVQLQQIEQNHIAIVKKVKSRIIQKDALKLIEIANTIRTKDANVKIGLICNNNICSKSVKLLEEHGIDIGFINEL